jgi:hypothetical protein
MKTVPIVSLTDLYANWMAAGTSMMLGEFPSPQSRKAAPVVAPRKKARRAAPAKKRTIARKAKGAKRSPARRAKGAKRR